MPHAACMLRDTPHYRRDAFIAGLQAAGFNVGTSSKLKPKPGDVMVIWNRYGMYEMAAQRYERAGATIIVAENGYLGVDGDGHQLYAMSLSKHNGAGTWNVGAPGRWKRFGIHTEDWRPDGDDILVLPQRGIGSAGVAMPKDWASSIVKRLGAVTRRRIRVREHPGQIKTDPILDLAGCWAAVTWASGAGLKAITGGIPVFYEMPTWIGAPAAQFGIENIEAPYLGDREAMLDRLAWAQFSLEEISSGEAFYSLLEGPP